MKHVTGIIKLTRGKRYDKNQAKNTNNRISKHKIENRKLKTELYNPDKGILKICNRKHMLINKTLSYTLSLRNVINYMITMWIEMGNTQLTFTRNCPYFGFDIWLINVDCVTTCVHVLFIFKIGRKKNCQTAISVYSRLWHLAQMCILFIQLNMLPSYIHMIVYSLLHIKPFFVFHVLMVFEIYYVLVNLYYRKRHQPGFDSSSFCSFHWNDRYFHFV